VADEKEGGILSHRETIMERGSMIEGLWGPWRKEKNDSLVRQGKPDGRGNKISVETTDKRRSKVKSGKSAFGEKNWGD